MTETAAPLATIARKRKAVHSAIERCDSSKQSPAEDRRARKVIKTEQRTNRPTPPLSTLQRFEAVFPKIVQDVRAACDEHELPSEVWKALEQSLAHNATGGKYNRAISVVDTAAILLERDLTAGEFMDLARLGWMIELFQAFMLICDDIMDGSKTRRGRPCWYKVLDVGLAAINDACLLESVIFLLLKTHFREHSQYLDFVELFHETAWRTELGQAADMRVAPEQPVYDVRGARIDLQKYGMSRYKSIVKLKTAYYSFYTPMALATMYVGKATPKALKRIEVISSALGEYFQIQDDYLDCFGDPAVLGKVGMDIQDNKCSWLVCQALMRCDANQRKILDLNYGKKDSQCEKQVKELYTDLCLPKVYADFEQAAVARIGKLIDTGEDEIGMSKEAFRAFLRQIQRREK